MSLIAGLGGVLAVGVVSGATARVDASRRACPGDRPAGVLLHAHARSASGTPSTLRPPHRDRRDRLVLLARPGRPERRPQARDRGAVLLDVRVQREGPPAGPEARRPTGRVYAPEVVADLEGDGVPRHRGRRHGQGGGVLVPARQAAPEEGLAGVGPQRWPDARGARARRRRPEPRRQGRGGGDDDQHLVHRRAGLRLQRPRQAVPAASTATTPPGPATTG